jgi:hypothetical protein
MAERLKTSIYYLRTARGSCSSASIAPRPVAQVADEMEDEPFCAVCSA